MRTFFILPILLLAAAVARAEDPLVVLAAARTGHIEFFDVEDRHLNLSAVTMLTGSFHLSPGHRRAKSAEQRAKHNVGVIGLGPRYH